MDYVLTDDKTGVPIVEVYPACEHRFRVENPDGTEFCWICGVTLREGSLKPRRERSPVWG